MAYTDKQLKEATQVAYVDMADAMKELEAQGKQPPYTIGELKNTNTLLNSTNAQVKLREVPEDWKVVDYYDTNDTTGFYGCVIETSSNEAIVAFRGSEDMGDPSNLLNDWILSDFGLLNSTQTVQHAEVEKYINKMIKNDTLGKYTNIASTGHSLGGNLSDHFTILMAKYGLDYKISQSVSLDGPNVSREYIEEHQEYIDKVSRKMVHYKWSGVSACLHPLPGVKQENLGVQAYELAEPYIEVKGKELYYIIGKHSTTSLVFDKNGSAQRGEKDKVSEIIEEFSQNLDDMPAVVADGLNSKLRKVGIVYGLGTSLINQEGDFSLYGEALLEEIKYDFNDMLMHTNEPDKFYKKYGLQMVVAAMVAENCMPEEVTKKLNVYIAEINEIQQLSVETRNLITGSVLNIWNAVKVEVEMHVYAGYQYATNNPEICVNTDRLRTYASRIDNVNARVQNLESRINNLYWQVGFLDLLDLIRADLLVGHTWRLAKCRNYLENTANSFEVAENNIKRLFE